MTLSAKSQLAEIIKSMTYQELIDVANDLVEMQKGAREDGWDWKPNETHGEFGMANMLISWAESQEEENEGVN